MTLAVKQKKDCRWNVASLGHGVCEKSAWLAAAEFDLSRRRGFILGEVGELRQRWTHGSQRAEFYGARIWWARGETVGAKKTMQAG
jgi:hypothetical protein